MSKWLLSLGWIAVYLGVVTSLCSPHIHLLTIHGKCFRDYEKSASAPAHSPHLWDRGLYFLNNVRVSKKRFIDFYVIGLVVLLISKDRPDLSTRLYQVHLLRRVLEESRKVGDSSMSLAAYLLGIYFYLLAAPTVLENDDRNGPLPSYLLIFILLVANLTQMLAHHYLMALRRVDPTRYQVPDYFLFKRTFFPHYWAEVVIYLCVAAQRRTLPSILMCGAVMITLLRNALNQRVYYCRMSNTKRS